MTKTWTHSGNTIEIYTKGRFTAYFTLLLLPVGFAVLNAIISWVINLHSAGGMARVRGYFPLIVMALLINFLFFAPAWGKLFLDQRWIIDGTRRQIIKRTTHFKLLRFQKVFSEADLSKIEVTSRKYRLDETQPNRPGNQGRVYTYWAVRRDGKKHQLIAGKWLDDFHGLKELGQAMADLLDLPYSRPDDHIQYDYPEEHP